MPVGRRELVVHPVVLRVRVAPARPVVQEVPEDPVPRALRAELQEQAAAEPRARVSTTPAWRWTTSIRRK